MRLCHYPSNLSDQQWAIIRKLLPQPSLRGRRQIDRRRVIDAILYVNRTGCPWRYLPGDFPCWQTVYGVFRRWTKDGTWLRIHDALRGKVRRQAGKQAKPTAAILDSQSVKTEQGGEQVGYDAGKKIKGRKRHLLVDTLGLLLSAAVTSAAWQDQHGAWLPLFRSRKLMRKLKAIFADSAYKRDGLTDAVWEHFRVTLQTISRPVDAKGFVILPKRWIVERSFGWLRRYRRHSKDYEKLTVNSESMIYISFIQLMANRLAKKNTTQPPFKYDNKCHCDTKN